MWEIKQVSHNFLGGKRKSNIRSIYYFCKRYKTPKNNHTQAFHKTGLFHRIHHILVSSKVYEIMAVETRN